MRLPHTFMSHQRRLWFLLVSRNSPAAGVGVAGAHLPDVGRQQELRGALREHPDRELGIIALPSPMQRRLSTGIALVPGQLAVAGASENCFSQHLYVGARNGAAFDMTIERGRQRLPQLAGLAQRPRCRGPVQPTRPAGAPARPRAIQSPPRIAPDLDNRATAPAARPP